MLYFRGVLVKHIPRVAPTRKQSSAPIAGEGRNAPPHASDSCTIGGSALRRRLFTPRIVLFMPGFFSSLAIVLCWGAEPGSAPTAGEIAAAVQRLGADRFQQRQDASEFLWRAGDAAIPALREAARRGEPEVRLRAAAILENLKYGLYPDTPPEVAALVRRFRLGDRNVQRDVLHALLRQERLEHVLLLLQASGDASLQGEFLREVETITPRLLAEGREEDAETILALAAESARPYEQGQRNYAAFLLLQGRLDEKIAELEAAGPADDRQARLLAKLLETRGDYSAALGRARQAEDESLTSALLFRLGRWEELSEEQRIPGDAGVERFGFAAAFHRLAGNEKACEEALASLEKLAEEDPDEVWMCGEALMIAGAWDRAERVFARHSPARGFDLLASQLRADDAFRLIGVEKPGADAVTWYSQRASGLVKGSKESKAHFFLGLKAASLLHRLGERDGAARLFEETARSARTTSSLPMQAVVEAERKLGLRDSARERLVRTLPLPNIDRKALVTAWFPERRQLSGFWWDCRRDRRDDESEQESFAHLERLLASDAAERMPADEFAPLVEEAERSVLAKAPDERMQPLEMLGETCLLHGRRDLALRMFRQRTELPQQQKKDPFGGSDPSRREVFMRVADLLTEDQNWQEAGRWYRRAWEEDLHPLPLFLEGHALEQAGRGEEARSRKELASLICLADVERRSQLAAGLEERGHADAAVEQWRLVLQVGPWNAWEGGQPWAVSRASRQMGNHLSKTAPLGAAEHWRRWLMYLLKTNSSFLELGHYAQISHLIHKTRARGLADAGDWRGAVEEARLAQAALPADINFPLEFVPLLDEAGRTAEADAIFRGPFEAHRRLLEQFPGGAGHHNNVAWLAARCDRELEAALEYARRAVELAPDNPSYLDTLAEVHFRRGDKAEAIRLSRRCVELAPENDAFREQLERFEGGR